MIRGSYKKYLEEDVEVPQSTRRRQLLAQQPEQQENRNEEIQLSDESDDEVLGPVGIRTPPSEDMEIETRNNNAVVGEEVQADVSLNSRSSNNDCLSRDDLFSGNSSYDEQNVGRDIEEQRRPECVAPAINDGDTSGSGSMEIQSQNLSDITTDDEMQQDVSMSSRSSNNDSNDAGSSVYHDSDYEEEQNQRLGDIPDLHRPERVMPNERIDADPPVPEERIPIYEGCKLTIEESRLLILALTIKHNITDAALEDIIHVIDSHLPFPIHRSKYHVLKGFSNIPSIKTHYYCPECQELLSADENDSQCNNCRKIYVKKHLKKDGHFFLNFPLEEQLIEVLNKHFDQLQRENDTQSDVVTAKCYIKLRIKGVIRHLDITLQWSTDGVRVFKSSNISMWPIQVMINELPYRLRKENILLCGLWYGTEKPIMDIFLKPFIEELEKLHNDGILYQRPEEDEPIVIKVHTILATVDAPARSAVQNINQYNGACGCSYCLHEGERIPVGRGFARVYRGNEGLHRSRAQHEIDVNEAVTSGNTIRGVKGPTILMRIPIFDVTSSLPPDYMHCVLLGVTKMVNNAWFDPANSEECWYLGGSIEAFDNKLTAIEPPCEITRTPRSIKERALFKASEWKSLLLYYSLVCIMDLMPPRYIKHWFLFVFAMHIFLREKIAPDDIVAAEEALRAFVFDIENLYGVKYMTYNVHVLLHIPHYVKKFGALWAWSTFPYEDYNGLLRKMFKSSQSVPQQFAKSYLRLKSIKQTAETVFQKDGCNEFARELVMSLLGRCHTKTCEEVGPFLRLFGSPTEKKLELVKKLVIEVQLNEEIDETAQIYQRFIFKNKLYHGSAYNRLTKRNNCTVLLANETVMAIREICIVQTVATQDTKSVIVGHKLDITDETLCKVNDFSSNSYSYIVRPSNVIVACLPEMILAKCVHVPCGFERSCVLPLVNSLERD